MKFNIEVVIDWLGEEGNLDEEIQNKIVDKVVRSVSEKVIKEVTSASIGKIEEQIETLVSSTFDEIMNKEIVITDKWGDHQRGYKSAKDMIKEKFDNFLLEKVNRDGRANGYGDDTRFNYIVRNQLDKLSKEWTSQAVKEVTDNIKKTLSDDLRAAFGDKLLGVLDLESLLNKAKK